MVWRSLEENKSGFEKREEWGEGEMRTVPFDRELSTRQPRINASDSLIYSMEL